MELTIKSKEFLLHQIKQELLVAVHNLDINNIIYDIRKDYNSIYDIRKDYTGEEILILGIKLISQRMLSQEDIKSVNDTTKLFSK